MPGPDTKESSFRSVRRKIKAFLHRHKWKEALIFFAFVLLSFGFWYLQSLQQEYEIEIAVPVRYKNIPPEITFTDTVPDKIMVRVRDKGSALLNYTFARTFVPIETDMKNIKGDKGIFSVDRKDIESDIYKQLLSTTTLLSFEPWQINLRYSKRAEKDLPVTFNGTINLEPGFQIAGDIRISPANVQVYAADILLDTLSQVRTSFTQIKKANKTVTRIVPLQKQEGVAYNPESVSVTIPIEEFTDKTLDVPLQVTGIPSDYTVRLFPPTVKVISSIPLSRFKDLEEDQFSIQIPFTQLEQNLTGVQSISLSKRPDWVRSSALSPDKVEFILEQKKSE